MRAVKGMLFQILENLLANSFYWLKHQVIIDNNFEPKITISLDEANQTISVTDNGPGVEPERSEEIFKPFVTSKPPGEGNGLGLFIARELAEYHDWSLVLMPESVSREGALNTFELALSGSSK